MSDASKDDRLAVIVTECVVTVEGVGEGSASQQEVHYLLRGVAMGVDKVSPTWVHVWLNAARKAKTLWQNITVLLINTTQWVQQPNIHFSIYRVSKETFVKIWEVFTELNLGKKSSKQQLLCS